MLLGDETVCGVHSDTVVELVNGMFCGVRLGCVGVIGGDSTSGVEGVVGSSLDSGISISGTPSFVKMYGKLETRQFRMLLSRWRAASSSGFPDS